MEQEQGDGGCPCCGFATPWQIVILGRRDSRNAGPPRTAARSAKSTLSGDGEKPIQLEQVRTGFQHDAAASAPIGDSDRSILSVRYTVKKSTEEAASRAARQSCSCHYPRSTFRARAAKMAT